ncbi:MAG: 4'-phosphopantetheinyl transferase superfamily protein [Clostridia bacterium]|nr:4'-phosphopantetheinyl transferase superfamily protein [Clostridia bacterium]
MLEVEYKKIIYQDPSPRSKRELEHNACYELLFEMLNKHFGLSSVEILKTKNGKPYVDLPNVHFSLSHTDGLVACVVSDSLVGIDAEKMVSRDERLDDLSKRFFVQNEIELLDRSKNKVLDFYKIWCAKEATIKKLGETMALVRKIDTTLENFEYIFVDDYIICIKI